MNIQDERTKELGTKDIKSLLWAYALPSVITQVIASIYNIADRAFIGHGVSAYAIAGLAITFPIMNIIHAFGSLVGAGASARLSIVLGKKDLNWAENIVGNSMILTFLFGALFLSVGYAFMNDILGLFGATDLTIGYAREYLEIVLPGMFLTTMTFNLTGMIRSSGYPKKSMWIMVSGAILNVILDPIFIFGFKAGIAGAAWATTISMAMTAALSVVHFSSAKSFVRFRKHAWRPRLFIFKNILLIGMSPFLMNLAASGVVAIMNNQLLKYGGDIAVGALGICNTFLSMIVMVIIGICMGMQPIAGYNYGAGNTQRLKGIYWLTMRWNVAFGCVGAILGVVFPSVLTRIFTTDDELISASVVACRYTMVLFPIIAYTITNSNFFQSIDKPWISIVTSLSRQVIFLAPLSFILPEIFEMLSLPGIDGVWFSHTVSDVLGASLAGLLFLTQRKIFTPNKKHS